MYRLLVQGYECETSADNAEQIGLNDWVRKKSEESLNFKYWTLGLKLLLRYFIFVRSYREANYFLYKKTLREWIPWFFVFDHHNYMRYATAHLVDLGIVEEHNADMYNLLLQGVFQQTRPVSDSVTYLQIRTMNRLTRS